MSPRPEDMVGLPPLYAGWMAALLDAGIPAETRADCASCTMCSDAGSIDQGVARFNPSSKCCTFFPDLQNFLAGQILADDDPAMAAGRAALCERIDARIAVTPLAVARPRSWWVLYQDGFPDLFGRAGALRCPYYVEDGGLCGVWKYRDATCSTFFCKHERGELGLAFWRSVQSLLVAVERNLAWWCLQDAELDVGMVARLQATQQPDGGGKLDADELEGRPPRDYHALWGPWAGRERDFYLGCAERVGALRWPDVFAICPPEVKIMAQVTRKWHARLLDHALPGRLRARGFQVVAMQGKRVHLRTYRDYDPIEVPTRLLEALPALDGRATEDVIADPDSGVDRALVGRLVDFGVLRAG